MSDQLPELATPAEVAEYLHTTTASLAQDRYKGTGPKFLKHGRRVLYRWSDVAEWLDQNTFQRTDLRAQR
ncbi:helix-turn-helix domain-containing protein [Mycobacterium sp.]|uniref:helix-turn-helix transcriptional regulator n=1 Tax=Mycobacterium sp. TaxID=1785 RepID=UPI000CBAB1C0|nr:helix-turn-helix domain-containing protein [Mycobacterium sp.]PJE01666.1 MAG: DNA-binding protein [Mycobacterium sp.]